MLLLYSIYSGKFPQVLKNEVELMAKMAKTIDGFTQHQTRLAVVIDGLDSCEQDKVLQMLDTVRHHVNTADILHTCNTNVPEDGIRTAAKGQTVQSDKILCLVKGDLDRGGGRATSPGLPRKKDSPPSLNWPWNNSHVGAGQCPH